jgi:hypothetical protein
MLFPHAPNEQRGFEIVDRPYDISRLHRQPTIEFNFKHDEYLAVDFVEPHSYPKLNN